MIKCGIYVIRNTKNGKVYIGQSTNIKTRWQNHLSNLRHGGHRNNHLLSAFLIYGENAFEFSVLEVTPEYMLDVRERVWTGYYKSNNPLFGYNNNEGGGSGHHLSLETRLKLSEAWKHRPPYSDETRRKISVAHKGRIFSAETRRKISESNTGRKHTEEAKRNMSKAQKERIISPEHRRKLIESRKGIASWIKGRHHSAESRQKISLAKKGKKLSIEHIQKISKAHKGKKLSIEHRRNIGLAVKRWRNDRRKTDSIL